MELAHRDVRIARVQSSRRYNSDFNTLDPNGGNAFPSRFFVFSRVLCSALNDFLACSPEQNSWYRRV
jgi:hypothetical protein